MALVSGAEVASLRRSALQQTAAVDARALADVVRRGEEERFRGQMNGLLGLSAACVGVYVYLKLQSLSKEYPTAYAWWDNAQLEGPEAEGEHSLITVPSAARRVEFPALYYAQTMIMAAETLPLSGAEFLLSMATHFSKFMNPVHWNGSPAQLRRTYLDRFLPRDARGKEGIRWSYVWSAWNKKNAQGELVNPWAGVLFSSPQAMANSPAFQAYYAAENPSRGFVEALFDGGLVEVAVLYGASSKSGSEMARHLMGSEPTRTKVPCTSRVSGAVQGSIEYGMYAGMAAGVGGHAGAAFAAARKLGSMGRGVSGAIPLLITLAGFGAGAVAGARKCKPTTTSYSGLGAGKSV